MSFPFRQPVNTEDSPDESAELPEYASPHKEQAELPDYAKPHKAEAKPRSFKPEGAQKFYEATKGLVESGKKAWDWASKPLTEAPTKAAEAISQRINPRSETEGARGVGSAFVEGLGHAVSGLSSPVNLALTAATGGAGALESSLPRVAQGLRTGARALSVPVAAEGGRDVYEGVKEGDIPKALSGGLELAGGALGMRGEPSVKEHPSVRQSREIPYRMEEQEKAASGPNTGITPAKKKENEPLAIETKPAKQNPFKKKIDTSQADKIAAATKAVVDPESPLPTRSPNLRQEFQEPPVKQPTKPALSQEEDDAAFMKYQRENPRPVGPLEPSIKQSQYSHNNPELGGRQYDIEGGSTVSEKEAVKRGYELPESPTVEEASQEPRLSGAQQREKAISARDAHQIPEYAKPHAELPDVTQGFGGSGHPDSPDYVSKVLQSAGNGEPGLAVESKEGFQHVVYRGKDGNPIAAAKVVTDSSGKSMIQDLAADKSKGLLTGRAMKALAGKLQELKATEPAGTISPDATNFLNRMKARANPIADQLKSYSEPPRKSLFEDESGSLNLDSIKNFMSSIYQKMSGGSAVKDVVEESKRTVPEIDKTPGGKIVGAVTKLLSALDDAKGSAVEQSQMLKVERARRFSAFAATKGEGTEWAKSAMSKLKGEYEKVPGQRLGLSEEDVSSLHDAIKAAPISVPEKAQSITSLGKLLTGISVPTRSELATLDNVFGNGFGNKIVEMHGGIGAVGIKLAKLGATAKSMENSISLAAPLRHGIGLAYRKEFYPAFKDMFKFYGNKEYSDSSMQAIREHPNYDLFRESGGFLSKAGSAQSAEEEFLDSYVRNIPRATGIPQIVGASQRGYTGFLNKLRFDTFKSMTEQAKKLGVDLSTTVGEGAEKQVVASKEAKAIAKYINTATGRGDLPFGLNKITQELNTVLWSPRMMASRLTMFTNPKFCTDLPKGMRLEGLKSLLGIAALGTTIDTLGAYGGAKVSTNILSSDAGKSRLGTKLIDPWGGFQQYVVGAARFLAGKTDSNTPTSRLDIAGRFLANKESPLASLAHTLLTAKKFTGNSLDPTTAGNFTTEYGQKTNIQSEVGKRFVPIFIQDIHDLATSDPKWSDNIGLSAIMGVASLAGMSQSYPEKKPKLGMGKMRLKP